MIYFVHDHGHGFESSSGQPWRVLYSGTLIGFGYLSHGNIHSENMFKAKTVALPVVHIWGRKYLETRLSEFGSLYGQQYTPYPHFSVHNGHIITNVRRLYSVYGL